MIDFTSYRTEITDASQVGEARRLAVSLGQRCGFGEVEAGKLGIIATEASNNICKHAGRGCLVMRHLQDGENCGVEILAIGKGPGMLNVQKCLVDGYSTAGTPGQGLGSITRLSSEWDIYSAPGAGTIL